MRSYLLGALGSLVLASCATGMNEGECLSADWQSLGYQDGINGRSLEALDDRAAQCSKFGVLPDQDRYLLGRGDGVSLYCTPESALAAAEAGDSYQGVCLPDEEPGFLAAFSVGREFYLVGNTYERAQDAYTNHLDRIRRTETKIAKKVEECGNIADPGRYERLKKEIDQLRREKRDLENDLASLQSKLTKAEDAFYDFQTDYTVRVRDLFYGTGDADLEQSEL